MVSSPATTGVCVCLDGMPGLFYSSISYVKLLTISRVQAYWSGVAPAPVLNATHQDTLKYLKYYNLGMNELKLAPRLN